MKGKDILISVLVTIILALATYIITDKFFDNKKETNKEPEAVENKEETKPNDTVISSIYKTKIGSKEYTVDVDETKYNTIFDYIDAQEDVSIKVYFCTGINEDGSFEGGDYTLTKEETKTVLDEMKKSKEYYEDSALGGVCVDIITISYKRNNVNHKISFYSVFYAINETDDGNIYKIYDKNITGSKYVNYGFDSRSETIEKIIQEKRH